MRNQLSSLNLLPTTSIHLHKHFEQIALSQLKKDQQKLIPGLKELLPSIELNVVSDDEDEKKFDAGQNDDDLEGFE